MRLGWQSWGGTFSSDECFHAYVAEWMLAHRGIPDRFPELYSGLFYYYQPLFHVLAAAWSGVLGVAALHLLPAVLTGAMLAILLWGPPSDVPAAARRWAVLACVASPLVSQNGVRLYVEPLTTLMSAATLVVLLRWRASPAWRWAWALGVIMGLALLTKFHAWWWLGFIAALAATNAARGRPAAARQLVAAMIVALVVASPWLVRNQLLFGSALYPALAPDIDHALYALNVRRFSTPPQVFMGGIPGMLGLPLGVASVIALGVGLVRKPWGLGQALLGFGCVAIVASAVVPMTSLRHIEPFIPILALGAAWILAAALTSRRALVVGLETLLVVGAAVTVIGLPDRRGGVNLPPHLAEAFEAMRSRVPPTATVLSLWTYDTFYYTRRAATWPNPWGQRVHPVEPFQEADPARFAAALHRYGIDYVLVPASVRPEPFNSANYPESFIRCLAVLLHEGRMRIAWQSPHLVLVEAPGRRAGQPDPADPRRQTP